MIKPSIMKPEKKNAVIAALAEKKDLIVVGRQPLILTNKAEEIWIDIANSHRDFFSKYPSVFWNEGGIGGEYLSCSRAPEQKKN